MNTQPRPIFILLVDDDPDDVSIIHKLLHSEGTERFKLIHASLVSEAIIHLMQDPIDAILLKINLAGDSDLLSLHAIQPFSPCQPILMFGRLEQESLAVEAIKQGAQDYIIKEHITQASFTHSLITAIERQQLKLAFEKNERNLRLLNEKNADGIVAVNQKGEILYVNPAAEILFGRSTSDLLGNAFGFPVITAESTEVEILQTGNGIITVEMRSAELEWDHQPAYVISLRDITERKQYQDALQRNENLLRIFVEHSPAAIAMLDHEMKYIVASRRYLIDYDLGDQNLVGRSHYDLFPEIPDRWKEIHQRCLAGATERAEEDPFPRANGKIDWVRWEIRPWYETNGKIGGIILFSEVITERKRSEIQIHEQLEQLSALRKIDRSITTSYSLRATLDTINEQVISRLHVNAADVLLLNPEGTTLMFASGRGFQTRVIESTLIPVGKGHAGRVVSERHMIRIDNLKDHPNDILLNGILASEEFVCYLGMPLIAKGKIKGVLEVYSRESLNPSTEWFNFFGALAEQTAIAVENAMLFENLEHSHEELIHAYDATIEGWSRALDLRDKETEGHTLRVTTLTLDLAQRFGFTDENLLQIRWGGLLHDIGKMGVPDRILLKPDQLTNDEWAIMKMHPIFAYEMLSPIDHLKTSLEIPYCHHEKWDGTGYPRGLKGEEIPLTARIFAVADVWDAITSDRPYRPAWTRDRAIEYIRSQSGSHFDPSVVELFLEMIQTQK